MEYLSHAVQIGQLTLGVLVALVVVLTFALLRRGNDL